MRIILWIIFLGTLVVLTKNILLKNIHSFGLERTGRAFTKRNIKKRWATANLVPFKTIRLFYNSRFLRTEYKMVNLLGNLAGFIPIGFCLPVLMRRRGFLFTTFLVFLVSLGFETCQLLFDLGVFDVDDLILNTGGGLIGYIFCRIVFYRKFETGYFNRSAKASGEIAVEV